MADSKKYDGSQWGHSLRKLTTATEAVENPLYSDGTAITAYTLKGNTVQNGTPTPSNPVEVNGVGVRTAQLLDFNTWANNVYVVRGTKVVSGNSITITSTAATCFTGWNTTEYPAAARIPVTEGETIHLTWDTDADDSSSVWIFPNASATGEVHTAASNKSLDYTVPSGVDYITFRLDVATANKTITYSNIMFNSGSTAKPYEPYGYKIPISSGQQTIDIYIGDLPLLKSLDGTAVDEISNGILTRRVDSDGSVLPTPTTTQITMPSIPTTDGANSITVDTTVQPSEFTATWTGWHDASVKEKSENCLDENDFGLVEVAAGTYRDGTDVGVLPSGKYTFNAVKSSSAVQIYRTTKNGSTYNYETITNLPYTFTADGVSNQIFRSAGNTGSSWADLGYTNVMLNTGETAQTYEPYWK